MLAVENLVRGFCERALDPFVGAGGFDIIAHLGAMMPMQTIGYLLGIPEGDQANIRDTNGVSLELASGATPGEASSKVFEESITLFAEYIEWRAAHPSDDLMTELLEAEVEESDGTRRRLSRDGGPFVHRDDRRRGERDDRASHRLHGSTALRSPGSAS